MTELRQVAGEDIYKYSNLFALALSEATPPFVEMTDVKKEKVLKEIRSKNMTGWLVYDKEETLLAIAITKIVEDKCLETKDLLIYCGYGLNKVSLKTWDEAFKAMAAYGLDQKCTSMTAYSCVDKVKQMAVKMGGNADMVYLNIPLKGK